MLGAIVSVSSI